MEGFKQCVWTYFFNMWIFLKSVNLSVDVVISCSVRADTVGVKRCFVSCFTACVRPKLDVVGVDITSHPVSSFDRTSQPILSVDRTSHPILSVDDTPLPLVSDAATLVTLVFQ